MIKINNIKNHDWKGTKVSILGAGKSGIAAAKLCNKIGAKPFISDSNTSPTLIKRVNNFANELGGHTTKVFDAELIIISPGVPNTIEVVKECEKENLPIISEIEFASWFTESPIIAVTGSNGKSTTVSLIHEIFQFAGYNSFLGGNLDKAFSELVVDELNNKATQVTYILEVSSFQLEYIYHFNPLISVILNISKDHMDRYKNMEDYTQAKLNIIKNLREPGWLIYNSGDILLSNQLHDYDRVLPFSQDYCHQALLSLNKTKVYSHNLSKNKVLFYLDEIKIKGVHNLENLMAAATVALKYGINEQNIRDAIIDFKPLPHRLEFLTNYRGVKIFNDSKATNLSSTISAVNTIKNSLILILGGRDKSDTDFNQLIPYLENKTKFIIAYGDAGVKITNTLSKTITVEYFNKFNDAVNCGIKLSQPGDTILLSPACSSFDQFENFEKRGECFRSIILEHSNVL